MSMYFYQLLDLAGPKGLMLQIRGSSIPIGESSVAGGFSELLMPRRYHILAQSMLSQSGVYNEYRMILLAALITRYALVNS